MSPGRKCGIVDGTLCRFHTGGFIDNGADMNYSTIKKRDIANGPGVRVSLYVSGCTHHCKGCFNPETWDFNNGEPFDDIIAFDIIRELAPDFIRGFSLLGGEPFEPQNSEVLAGLLKMIRGTYPDKTIWCYSGYLLDEQLLKGIPGNPEKIMEMLSCIDVLVDGEFKEEEKVVDLRFRGSTNQRIIDVPKTLSAGEIVLWKDDSDFAQMENEEEKE